MLRVRRSGRRSVDCPHSVRRAGIDQGGAASSEDDASGPCVFDVVEVAQDDQIDLVIRFEAGVDDFAEHERFLFAKIGFVGLRDRTPRL